MGYSAYVICRSVKARDRMHVFLGNQVTPWCELAKISKKLPQYRPEYDYTRFPVVGDGIAYGGRKLSLGYNFTTQGDSSGYLWCLLRFAALRVGRDRVIDGVKTRFTVYDGCEFLPVGDCDENGYRDGGNKHLFMPQMISEADRVVGEEMKRLGRLWPAGVLYDLELSTA
jgi:hypothetical protein